MQVVFYKLAKFCAEARNVYSRLRGNIQRLEARRVIRRWRITLKQQALPAYGGRFRLSLSQYVPPMAWRTATPHKNIPPPTAGNISYNRVSTCRFKGLTSYLLPLSENFIKFFNINRRVRFPLIGRSDLRAVAERAYGYFPQGSGSWRKRSPLSSVRRPILSIALRNHTPKTSVCRLL